MYESLRLCAKEFHLYIFPFDARSLKILRELNLDHVTLISLKEFENEDMLHVKPTRSKGEYCWTCTPYAIQYALEKFDLPQCTYLDADLCFYGDPGILLNEMGEASILITEHRYTPEYDQSVTSGIYCVQFLSIKNDMFGLEALHWWRDRCLEWCYGRVEDGKFGDQKYLDDWTTRFRGVHVLRHIGGGVAPWNVQQYELTRNKAKQWRLNSPLSEPVPLIFYHFHYVRFLDEKFVDISPYRLDLNNVLLLYANYIRRLHTANRLLAKYDLAQPQQEYQETRMWLAPWDKIKRIWRGTYNVFDQHKFIDRWQD